MASTIDITFQVQPLDGGQSVRGTINVDFSLGNLPEKLTLTTPTTGFFQEVPWVSGLETTLNAQQAQNFANAFNRDYRNVGGTKNLGAKVTDNVVTITASNGTFGNSTSYTGDILVVGFGVPSNNVGPNELVLDVSRNAVGDCNTVQYIATASEGTPPYTLTAQGTQIAASWDGTAQSFNLNRNTISKITVLDSLGESKESLQNVPKNIAEGEFTISYTQFDTFSDIVVTSLVDIAGAIPYEYAIAESDGSNKSAFQASNVFPGIAEGTYRVYIRDSYDCEIFKNAVVTVSTDNINDKTSEIFLIPKANSIAWLENNEKVNIKYSYEQMWKPEELITTQFKSSFPYHNLTLKGLDGSKRSINFLNIQQNIGFTEKVDCVLYNLGGFRSVYFNGGNEYEPNTLTVKGASEYNNFTPSWAVVGRTVSFEGIGSTTIRSTGFDSDKQKYYFQTNLPETGVETASQVQVTYNSHGYNLYESVFNMGVLTTKSYFEYEYGYSETEIVGSVCSVFQIPHEENCKALKIDAWDSLNKGNMVFQSGIKSRLNIVGTFYKTSITESETSDGDASVYSLTQKARSGWKLELDLLPPAMWEKLDILSGLEYFYVNDILLKRTSETAVSRIGQTNLRTWEAEFGYGSDELGAQKDETVFSITTGIEGGGSTGKSTTNIVWDGQTRLVDGDGNLVTVGGANIGV